MKIAEFDADIYRNSEIFVELAPDRQEAFVTVTEPQGGNSATFDEVIEKLSENGVVFGLMEKEINEIIFDKKYNEKKVVAQAKKPLQGENAKLHYKVSLSKDVKPQMMEDGRVDFKSLNIITNVVKGEVLAELIPETAGTPGTNILGEEIPATPGSPVKIESFVGKNVEISEEGNKIISQIDGQIVVEGERLSVVAIYTVEGDVDLNVGNIDFIGSVFVKGNVLDGFHIKAKGNIEIEKSVGASNIEATGDIVIKGGIMGKDAGLIKAGGNIFVKFIENGKIITDKEVMVGKAIMHSNVRASKIHVSDGKGLIVGGIIKAQEEIDCKILGSHLATKTSVIIGIKEEIMRRIEEIDAEVTKIYDDMDKVNEAIDLLKNLKKRLGNLPEDKEEKLQKYQMLISSLEKKSESLMEERDRHEEEIEGSQGGKLKVKEVIYPGVTVTIRKGVMHIKDEVKFASIVYEDGYLKINPYS
jgi:uncharacterized protein (DUF342 family)